MHKRDEIKDKIVAMLTAGLTESVFKSRYLPINVKKFPAVSVYIPEEETRIADTEEHYDRTAKVVIAVYCKGKDTSELSGTENDDIDSELDALTLKIEQIFCTVRQTLEKTIYRFTLTKTRYMVNTEGEEIIGIAYMDFDASYKDSLL